MHHPHNNVAIGWLVNAPKGYVFLSHAHLDLWQLLDTKWQKKNAVRTIGLDQGIPNLHVSICCCESVFHENMKYKSHPWLLQAIFYLAHWKSNALHSCQQGPGLHDKSQGDILLCLCRCSVQLYFQSTVLPSLRKYVLLCFTELHDTFMHFNGKHVDISRWHVALQSAQWGTVTSTNMDLLG